MLFKAEMVENCAQLQGSVDVTECVDVKFLPGVKCVSCLRIRGSSSSMICNRGHSEVNI